MDYMVVISAVVLGLSVLATVAKFLDWFVHSDPHTMVRTSRWMLLLILLACIPLLILMIAREQWAVAMLIGAGMLIVPTLLKWRTMFAPLRAVFDYFRPKARPLDMEIWDDAADDPETVRRAAAILEAYVSKASSATAPALALSDERRGRDGSERGMSEREALDVLGLDPGADETAIRAACKRLLGLVHPDQNGSAYLARKVQQAREVLLGPVAREWPSSQQAGTRRNRLAKR